MNPSRQSLPASPPPTGTHSELLILPDGRVLVHNLTPVMAKLLGELNPAEEEIRLRIESNQQPLVGRTHEFCH